MVSEHGDSTDVIPDAIEKPIPQKGIQQRVFEETVDVTVPQHQEHLVEMTQIEEDTAKDSEYLGGYSREC